MTLPSFARTRWLALEPVYRRFSNYWIERTRPWFGLFLFMPMIFSGSVFLLLSSNGQLLEIYRRVLEESDIAKFATGLFTLVALSWMVSSYYLSRTSNQLVSLYGGVSRHYLSPGLQRWRYACALVCALAPFLGILWGIWSAQSNSPAAIAFAALTAATGVLLAAILYAGSHSRVDWFLPGERLKIAMLCAIFLPMAAPAPLIVDFATLIGPLGMIGWQLFAAFIVAEFLVKYLPGFRDVIRRILIASAVGYAIHTAWTLLSASHVARETGIVQPVAAPEATAVHGAFEAWLRARPGRAKTSGKAYPVFVVAAEGGGIYAASAVARFLAQMRDKCPSFAQHVFAISGVSGGSVGAAIYSGLPAPAATDAGAGCADARDLGFTETTDRILKQDHLSPILAVIVPDLLMTIAFDLVQIMIYPAQAHMPKPLTKAAFDGWNFVRGWLLGKPRSQVLELSFICAQTQASGSAGRIPCRSPGADHPYVQPFAAHFGDGTKQHALILNTTQAASGSTVAFSPFKLGELGDPSFASFLDAPYDDARSRSGQPGGVSMAEAAIASARFPLVLPPYVLEGKTGNLYFVDGGYADNSGVAIAEAIFSVLQKSAAKQNADLRLILLTSEKTVREPQFNAGAAAFIDLRTPIETLLSVRAANGSREIGRMVRQYGAAAASKEANPLILIQLGTKFFLGWTISGATFDVIKQDIALPPAACNGKAMGKADETMGAADKAIAEMRRANKMEMCRIFNLLDAK